jgi:hypothetical protein
MMKKKSQEELISDLKEIANNTDDPCAKREIMEWINSATETVAPTYPTLDEMCEQYKALEEKLTPERFAASAIYIELKHQDGRNLLRDKIGIKLFPEEMLIHGGHLSGVRTAMLEALKKTISDKMWDHKVTIGKAEKITGEQILINKWETQQPKGENNGV